MTTYLVTGGTGFIGRHLVDLLVKHDDARVVVLVRRQSTGKLGAFGDRVEPLIGDLTEPMLGVATRTARGCAEAWIISCTWPPSTT